MARSANYSLAKDTWSSYRTVKRHMERCQRDLNIKFSFPMEANQTLCFIAWLLNRKIKSCTIRCYLSGLRTIHLTKGLDQPALRPPIINSILDGRAHIDTIRKRLENKPVRLPVTVAVLKLLRSTLNDWQESEQMIRLVWAVCLIAFFGGFRIHELLTKNQSSYDPAFTLLTNDVKVEKIRTKNGTQEILQVKLKSPKEDRIGKDIIVDVYETKTGFCPVRAYKKWKNTCPPLSRGKPAFRQPNGIPLTGRKFNIILKKMLSPHLDYKKGKISSHSFRSGMASLLGQLGMTDEQIQVVEDERKESLIKLSAGNGTLVEPCF